MGRMKITGSLSDIEFLDGEPQVETQREQIARLTYSERLHAEALGAAVREVEHQAATISRLMEYAGHKQRCLARVFLPCDCGYDALLAALEETK